MRFFVRDGKRSAKKAFLIVVSIMALVVQPMYSLIASRSANALGLDYTSVPFVLGEWSVDRALPTGGHSIANFAGQANTLEMSLDKDLANMSGTGFYQTEGLKRTAAIGTTALKANLYVDSDWIDNGKTVRAGLWGTAQNAINAISAYPIVEFTTDGHTGWRSYNTITGVWNNSAATYNVDAWNTIEIQLDSVANQFTYLVNGAVIGSAQLNGSTSFKEVILNSKNYGSAAQSYSVRWSNFYTGVHVATAITNLTTGVMYDDLQVAVDAAIAGDTLRLNEDIVLGSDVDITKNLTIDGNSKTITANFVKSGSDNSALAVAANDVVIRNVTLDGVNPATNQLHGINAYVVTNLLVDGVTAKNFRTGIVYNGSTGTVQNVHTMDNIWHGINADQGTGVTAPTNLQVLGTNTHTEPLNIYVDDTTKNVTVNAPAYNFSHPGLKPNDRVYTLKPTVPTLISPANNAVQNVNDFYFTWSNTGAAEYEFQSSQNPATDPTTGALTSGVWNNKLHGGPDRNHLTTPEIHSYGANGTWYWQVRAIDSNGIKSDWSTVWKMTIDMVAPAAPTNLSWKTTTNVVVPDGSTTNVYGGTASWQASASSDVDHYVYKYWNDIVGNQYKVGNEYIVPTSATSLPGVFNQGEGVHHFCVAAVDAAGNTSACTQFTITYDKTAPAISSITYNASPSGTQVFTNGYTNEENFVFHLAADADTTRYQLKYWNDISGSPFKAGSPWNPTDLSSTGHMATLGEYTDNFTQGEGVHYFSFSACDAAGNCSAYGDPFVVTYDNTAPVVTVNSIADIQLPTNTQTITGTVADANTVTGVEVSTDGGATWQPATTFDGTNWTYDATGLSVETYTVVAHATDAAGNTSSDDTSSPADYWTTFTVTAVTPPNSNTNGNTGAGSNGVSQTSTNQFAAPGSTNASVLNANNNGNATTDTTPTTDEATDTDVLAATTTDSNKDSDAGQVLAAEDTKGNWSVVNLVLAVVTIILSLGALLGLARKKDGTAARIMTLIPVAIAVTAFLMIENWTASMIWFNWWTVLYAVVLAVQVAIVSGLKNSAD